MKYQNLTIPEQSSNTTSGISIENASYIENSLENDVPEIDQTQTSIGESEEFTPQLFSDESSVEENKETVEKQEEENHYQGEKLFAQEINEDEEDFEIPAFLRRQKF